MRSSDLYGAQNRLEKNDTPHAWNSLGRSSSFRRLRGLWRARFLLDFVCIASLSLGLEAPAQTEAAVGRPIEKALNKSLEDWNRGDIDGYLSLYEGTADVLLVGPVNVKGFRRCQNSFETITPPSKLAERSAIPLSRSSQ